jgi:hypothetical protein
MDRTRKKRIIITAGAVTGIIILILVMTGVLLERRIKPVLLK